MVMFADIQEPQRARFLSLPSRIKNYSMIVIIHIVTNYLAFISSGYTHIVISENPHATVKFKLHFISNSKMIKPTGKWCCNDKKTPGNDQWILTYVKK